jgi:predicted ATPase
MWGFLVVSAPEYPHQQDAYMNTVTLTQGQKEAADAFLEFLLTDAKTFAISGSAGTGKTFLMTYLSDKVMKLYEQACNLVDITPDLTQCVFTATTNKAAEVLEQGLKKQVTTIHSLLGLKVTENYRTGKTEIQKTQNWRTRSGHIVFIDECSMIDKTLYAIIMESFPNSKIVFVGDAAQMAPVGESQSVLYDHLDPNHHVTLTEPVRNAGQPALVALCSQLRETVETGIFKPIEEVPGAIEYLDAQDMQAGLHHYFTDLDPACRVLCYTNEQVQSYNEFIREEVRHLPVEPTVGDVMVVAQAFSRGNLMLSVERELQVYAVGEIEENTKFQDWGVTIPFRNLQVGAPGMSNANLDFLAEIPVAVYPEQVNRLVKATAKQKDWATYFEAKGAFADLRDKSACTVYKAQGSTYDAVFVDLTNIGASYDPEQVARMLFVACSRARSNVYLYGQLPGRYHDSRGKPLWTPKDSSEKPTKPSLAVK